MECWHEPTAPETASPARVNPASGACIQKASSTWSRTVLKIASALLLLALPLAATAAMPCKFSEPHNADIDAAGLKSLQLRLGSSDLDIQSVPGLARIEVRGTACASDASWLKNLQLRSGRSGDQATVNAENDRNSMNFSLFGASYAYLKLQVRVPAALAVGIASGSGDVHATGLASLDFNSGSGDLTVDRIAGALVLQLGSADVQGHQVGSVELRGTGSGDVQIDGVQGSVKADQSGSGDLGFSNVRGSVHVGQTGSGDITLAHIGHDVDVGSTGSGDVEANDVGGDFSVHASGSGDIRHGNVRGKVSVPRSDDD
jgi:hypothetical protein